MDDFNLTNEKKITQKEWEEFQAFKEDYQENEAKRNFLLQQQNDLLEAGLTFRNIHRSGIKGFNIRAGAITADKIAAGAITADKITAGAITADKIAVGTITEDKIEDGTISADKIKAGTITTLQIAAGTIEASNIKAGTITATQIAIDTITTDRLKAGSISLATIASDFNWSTLDDDGNKPEDNADVTGNHTAKDIINLPDTPSGAGLYADGSYLGYYDGSVWKAYIQNNGLFYFKGDDNNYIQWNGSSLGIKGSITLVNTIPNTKVDGLGDLALKDSVSYGEITGTKPPSNADVTLTAIQGELSLAGGGLVLASAGAKIRGGQTAYGVGTGFWLGDVSGVSKFSIGSSTKYLKWDGSSLTIRGTLNADDLLAGTLLADRIGARSIVAGKIATGTITANELAANSVTASKIDVTSLSAINATLGTVHSGTIYSSLIYGTRFRIGDGTDEDIYFEDSAIRMYDGLYGTSKTVSFKYSTLNFLKFWYDTSTARTDLVLYSSSKYLDLRLSANAVIFTDATLQLQCTSPLVFTVGPLNFGMYGIGTLQLPKLGDTAPTEHDGDIAVRTSHKGLRLYDATYGWNKASTYTSGW